MSSDRTIVDAIKVAQDLLRQNLPSTHNLTDAAAVMRFRELVRSQAIRSAFGPQQRHTSHVCVAGGRARDFRSVADYRETINQLWGILDDPHLNNALGFPQNSRIAFLRSRF